MDSAVCRASGREQGFAVHALSVSYGQRHTSELDAAVRVARDIGAIEHKTVNVDLRSIGGSALTADLDVPLDSDQDADAPEIPVPTSEEHPSALPSQNSHSVSGFPLKKKNT